MLLVCWPDLAYQLYHLSGYLECFNYYCINCLAQQAHATISCAWYIYTGDYRVNEQRRFTTCLRGFWGHALLENFIFGVWEVIWGHFQLNMYYIVLYIVKFMKWVNFCILPELVCYMRYCVACTPHYLATRFVSTSFAHDVWHSCL